MIFVRLAGGLGNQIFQAMAALLLSKRTLQPIVVISSGLTSYQTARRPDVLRLLTAAQLLPYESLPNCSFASWLSVKARIGRYMPIFGFSDKNFPAGINDLHRRGHFNFLDGYFQSGWTGELLSEALAEVQLFSVPDSLNSEKKYDCVVHLRGGDFLRLSTHNVVGVNYYSRCISLACMNGCLTFGVITDDADYAQKIIGELRILHPNVIIDLLPTAADSLQDFYALRDATCRIIGNSTFAWWASAMDAKCAPTFSPNCFVKDVCRDFYLGHEKVVPV